MTNHLKKKSKKDIRYFLNIASWVDELRKMGKHIEDPEKREAFKESANIVIKNLIKMDRGFKVVLRKNKN